MELAVVLGVTAATDSANKIKIDQILGERLVKILQLSTKIFLDLHVITEKQIKILGYSFQELTPSIIEAHQTSIANYINATPIGHEGGLEDIIKYCNDGQLLIASFLKNDINRYCLRQLIMRKPINLALMLVQLQAVMLESWSSGIDEGSVKSLYSALMVCVTHVCSITEDILTFDNKNTFEQYENPANFQNAKKLLNYIAERFQKSADTIGCQAVMKLVELATKPMVEFITNYFSEHESAGNETIFDYFVQYLLGYNRILLHLNKVYLNKFAGEVKIDCTDEKKSLNRLQKEYQSCQTNAEVTAKSKVSRISELYNQLLSASPLLQAIETKSDKDILLGDSLVLLTSAMDFSSQISQASSVEDLYQMADELYSDTQAVVQNMRACFGNPEQSVIIDWIMEADEIIFRVLHDKFAASDYIEREAEKLVQTYNSGKLETVKECESRTLYALTLSFHFMIFNLSVFDKRFRELLPSTNAQNVDANQCLANGLKFLYDAGFSLGWLIFRYSECFVVNGNFHRTLQQNISELDRENNPAKDIDEAIKIYYRMLKYYRAVYEHAINVSINDFAGSAARIPGDTLAIGKPPPSIAPTVS